MEDMPRDVIVLSGRVWDDLTLHQSRSSESPRGYANSAACISGIDVACLSAGINYYYITA